MQYIKYGMVMINLKWIMVTCMKADCQLVIVTYMNDKLDSYKKVYICMRVK